LILLIGVLLPVLVPRVYVPYDPSNPASSPAPEQTASILSFLCYFYLDPLVLTTWRLPALQYDSLPPLADTDWSDNLRLRAMDTLDPIRRRELRKKEQHLLWGILGLYWKELVCIAFFLIMQVTVGFIGPIGINRLLTYMETGGEDAVVRPAVWISFIFIAPMLNGFALNLEDFVSTRMSVQLEAILTQLIFEHALRVRVTDDTPIATESAATSSTTPPDQAAEGAAAEVPTRAGDTTGTDTQALAVAEDQTVDVEDAAQASSSAPGPAAEDIAQDGKDKATKPDVATPSTTAMHLSGKINSLFGSEWVFLSFPS
jgi:hypothetical protein